jgi:hypothetical protein
MCATVADIASLAQAAAIEAAWTQWAKLGAPVASSATPRAVIDPEALLLLSSTIRPIERRVDDVLAWWAASGSALLSVQRTTSLLRHFPGSTRGGVAAFAADAVKAGDGRWSTLANGRNEAQDLTARGKRGREPRLASWPTLMLRLRAGFGVGLKADLLSLLLAENDQARTITTLSQATGYTAAAVRRGAQEMEVAGLVRRGQQRPAAYYVDSAAWTAVLGAAAGEPSGWRWFAQVFAFLAWTDQWATEHGGSSPYVAASAARDLVDANRIAFEQNRIPRAPEFSLGAGDYLDPFAQGVESVVTWLREKL